jgi:hypothetical protein
MRHGRGWRRGPVLEEQRAQDVTVDRDVPQRLRGHSRHEHCLAGEDPDLAQEAGRAVPDDLVAR